MQSLRKEAGGACRGRGPGGESLMIHQDRIQQYEDLADQVGHQPCDVALGWLLAQPAAADPIIGPSSQEPLDAARRALDLELDEPTLIRLDEISSRRQGGPGYWAW
jgi:aryl-alcohol dehydrogenase-like predicted oxidoreductase